MFSFETVKNLTGAAGKLFYASGENLAVKNQNVAVVVLYEGVSR